MKRILKGSSVMMWKKLTVMGFWIVLFTFLFSRISLAQDANTPPVSDKNIIYDMNGEAQIHRSNWDTTAPSQPLSVADEVDNSDTLVPVNGTNITILCADGNLVEVDKLTTNPPCNPVAGSNSGRSLSDNLIDMALVNRGSADTQLLITPNGKMLSNQPTFKWLSVKNAAQYQVVLTQNGALVWKKDYLVPATSRTMAYPKDEAPLAPGDYTVKIEALNSIGRPLSLDTPVTEITIVSDAVAKAVLGSVKAPKIKSVNTGMVAYRTARVLANNAFYADAIKMLEDALKISIPEGTNMTYEGEKPNSLRTGALPYVLLGNWYTRLNLPQYASVAYRNALQVAQQFDQPENAAWASVQQAVILTDLRQKYCGFAHASSFFSTVLESGAFMKQVKQQMDDAVKALGYEPTCTA